MKLQRFFFILFCLSFILNANAQTDLGKAPFTKFIQNENKSDYFLVSTKPVTNREYIIYLVWLHKVYGVDYPERLNKAIPGLNESVYNHFSDGPKTKVPNPFETVIRYADPFVRNYIFNPKYIDYPVIGISLKQANNYCKWLSDRYNENMLIQHGFLMADPEQSNANCFTTESYLAQQYEGTRSKESTVATWNDRMFLPVFRLPTEKEIALSKNEKLFTSEIKQFTYINNFLEVWQKWFLKVDKTSMTLNPVIGNIDPLIIKHSDANWDITKYKYEELTFDMNNNIPDYKDIFNKTNQKNFDQNDTASFKNEFGMMPYIILDEDENHKPLIVDSYLDINLEKKDSITYYYFRFVTHIKPGQYKP